MASSSEAIGRALPSRAAAAGTPLAAPAVLLTVSSMALVALGLIMILSASSITAFAEYGSSFLFFKKQLVWGALGIACFLFFARCDYRRFRGLSYLIFVVAVALLVVVLIPGLGTTVGGSARWIRLGALSFQPSEFAKLGLILFAADALSRKKERRLRGFAHTAVPVVPAVAVLALLVLIQPDLGTTLIFGAIGLGMMFVAGAPLRNLVPIWIVGSVGALGAAFMKDYRRARLMAFLDPWADPLNSGYQSIQSLIALGSGGLFGVGLGASRQKWMYIPNAHTDFIFAIIGEELGLFGSLVVLGIFVFIAYLGIRIARAAPDRFGMLVASGVTIWITVQALVNIGAVTATMPITGVPLPLVSFGGTSLVILLSALGMLVNIARRAESTRKSPRPRANGRAKPSASAS